MIKVLKVLKILKIVKYLKRVIERYAVESILIFCALDL